MSPNCEKHEIWHADCNDCCARLFALAVMKGKRAVGIQDKIRGVSLIQIGGGEPKRVEDMTDQELTEAILQLERVGA